MVSESEIRTLVQENKLHEARARLAEYLAPDAALDQFLFAEKVYSQIAPQLSFLPFKIAILRSITLEPLLPFLKIKSYENKINPQVYLGGYNIIDQEILDKNSGLYAFAPEVLIIFARPEEVCPKLLDSYLQLSREEIEVEIKSVLERMERLISIFRANSKAKVILHSFSWPESPAFGIVDWQNEMSQKKVFEKINSGLVEIVKKYGEVYLLDYEGLISCEGKNNWFDAKRWYTAKAPLSPIALRSLAQEYLKYFKAMQGKTKKVLVLDLDNTLWGGILGEEGLEGIKLGPTSPGNAFLDFQKELLKLYHKGFILALNSKNNEEQVLEVLEKHPYQLLKKEHFAAMKINWANKAQNLRALAEELNLGLDSFVFFDDSPVERELIKQQLPEVLTVEMPNDPHQYVKLLKELPDFERLTFTEEDRQKGEMYRAQVQRKKLEESSISLEDFYWSLEMEAGIKLDDPSAIPRLANMTQKTNQFNLTTIRYSENDISNFIASKDHRIYSLVLTDKFGDNGLVGEIIIREKMAEWEIDSFLLSCRVMGRTVETAFLSYLAEEGRKFKIQRIIGQYIPTTKNIPVKELYPQHGFVLVEEKAGTTIWQLDLTQNNIEAPPWIKIKEGK